MLPFGLPRPGDRPLRVVALGAHSDDIEIGAAGTLARLLAERPDTAITWAVMGAEGRRAEEALASARDWLAGARGAHVAVRPFADGFFREHWGPLKRAVREVAALAAAPDLVFVHTRDDRHPDHQVLAELAWDTFRDATILEYEIPKWDGDLGRPNLYAPLDAALAERKITALLGHFGTQRGKDWFDAATFRGLLRLRGLECRAPDGYAEAFCARKLAI